MRRAKRFRREPSKVSPVQIQERDKEILNWLYRCRFLNSEQITALVRGSEQALLRRLQKLYHNGYVDRPESQVHLYMPHEGTKPIVYAIGDKGADILAMDGTMPRGKVNWRASNSKVQYNSIEHKLMISQFRTCLTLAVKKVHDVNLAFWKTEEKMGNIRPDAYLGLSYQKQMGQFFLEVIRTTSNLKFREKLETYWENRLDIQRRIKGGFRVLIIAPSNRRMSNLKKEVDDIQVGWFLSYENLRIDHPEFVLQKVWHYNGQKCHILQGDV